MDTLVIVRKIREAEALADSGKHGEAKRLLEPLLTDNGLTETHRKLVTKKLDLFKKQHERMTRIISRTGTATSVRESADQSSERTAIRRPPEPDKSDRPTDLNIEKEAHGAPTEVVPRARDVDTEVPERGHRLKIEPRAIDAGPRREVSEPRREIKRPAAADSQELAPVSETDQMDALESAGGDDPRKTDMFIAPQTTSAPVKARQDQKEDESAPAIGRYAVDRPVYPVGSDTPAPGWRDTPVPQATPKAGNRADRSQRPTDRVVAKPVPPPPAQIVQDSLVNLSDTVMSPKLPEKPDDDSTYLMAEDYFTSRASARSRERSNPELKALAERLPDDDLRRELALEVVKLRQQVEAHEQEKRDSTRVSARKISREDKPESGSFHIPASQVNTIVRRAAGTGDIEVHMPGRDDDANELKVLRRDSVRGQKAQDTSTDRIALAQDYIDAGQIARPSLFKPIATWLGVAVVLAIIGWAVHLGWQSISRGTEPRPEITEDSAGGYVLGDLKSKNPDISDRAGQDGSVKDEAGWLIQYDQEKDQAIQAICVTAPLEGLRVTFNGDIRVLGASVDPRELATRFGGANPPFSQAAWDAGELYTMRFESKQGDRGLEFVFETGSGALLWIRLLDARDEPKSPSRDDVMAAD